MSEQVIDTEEPIHTWFGLTYANYLVLPRTLLQSMPVEWQRRFVGALEEMDAAFDHIQQAQCYEVTAGKEVDLASLTDAELTHLGIARAEPNDEGDIPPDTYYLKDSTEVEGWHRIVWPTADPVPHYNRGRTRVEPRIDGYPLHEVTR